MLGLAVATFLAALAFALAGLGDIAASQGHWPFVERFLDFGMRHAVKRHASGIEVPKLDDPNMIRLGAAHFHRGCAFCHGAGDPGKPNSQAHAAATARIGGDDAAVAAERPILDRQERLQIYRHAGMGRDRTRGRDLGRRRVSHAYQTLDAEAYRDLALGNVQLPEQSGAELATVESNPKASGACARCHGDKAQLPLSILSQC